MSNIDKSQLFNIGSASVSITPKTRVDLYTLDGVARNSDKLHSHLSVNTVTIGFGKNVLIIASLDLIWVDKIFTEKIREWANLEYSNLNPHLLLVATHSHSTPQISSKIQNSSRPDPNYLSFLYKKVCKSIRYALDNEEPCYADLRITNPDLTINRRKKVISFNSLKNGILKAFMMNRPNDNQIIDKSLHTVWFYNSQGNEKAVLLNYACHPTLFRKNSISSDFPGEVSTILKRKISKSLVVCFLQGFSGNIKANLTKNMCFNYSGVASYIYNCLFDRVQFNKDISQKEIYNFSKILAQSTLKKEESIRIKPQFDFFTKKIELPLKDDLHCQRVELEICYVSISDKLKIITLSGEIFSEYSLWLRKFLSHKDVYILTIGYCNDMIGYIPTFSAMQEGGYEVDRVFPEFAHKSPFSDRIERIIKEEIENLIV